MISPHLPVLQVLLPLVAAPLCVFLRRATVLWLLAVTVSAVSTLIAYQLLQQAMTQGVISYAIGGWLAPIGIEYRIDTLNAFVLLIVTGISSIVLLSTRTSIRKEIPEKQWPLFYTAYLLCFSGLLGITATGDAFNIFVFLEVSSLSSYALISLGKDRRALTASYQYLVMGTIGATFILIGIGLMYMITGTLNIHDLAQRLHDVPNQRTLITAFAFLFVGISLKLALFPLHLWLPNAYTYAPSVVSAFLAGTATKVAVYVLLRLIFTIFGVEYVFAGLPIDMILMLLAVAAIIMASLSAIYENNIKRMLAYSSVAQLGYMALGISFVSVSGLMATLLHLFNHALMKAALFMVIAGIVYHQGSALFSNIRGLGRRMPWTFTALVIGGLSLVGVPLTVGFVSKWYLVLAALEKQQYLLVIIVLLGSLLAMIYIWRLIEQGYFRTADDRVEVKEAPLSILISAWILVFTNIYFGIDTRLPVSVAEQTARFLLGGTS